MLGVGIGVAPAAGGFEQPFTDGARNGVNLVGQIAGTSASDKVLVVMAHYDPFATLLLARGKIRSIQPNDAQFLETRAFQVPDVARIFGVPPHLIADASNSTSWGSGLAEQNVAFGQFALRPWTARPRRRRS